MTSTSSRWKPTNRQGHRANAIAVERRRLGSHMDVEMADQSEIDTIRALLGSKPRPVGWAERRQRLDEIGSVWPVADDIKSEPADINGVLAEWSIAPGSDSSQVLLFFHGGGYCSGSIQSHRRLVTEAGRAAGMRTLAVAYRLAPENPFPAALEDAETAWRFLLAHGIAGSNIVVGGDSAGGGITLALLNGLRDAGATLPACGWLVSPWTDLTLSGITLASKDFDRSDHSQGLPCRTCRCVSRSRNRPPRSARFPVICRSEGVAAASNPSGLGRNAACRRHTFCRCGRRGRRGRHA